MSSLVFGEQNLSFRVHAEDGIPVKNVLTWARIGSGAWNALGPATLSEVGDGMSHIIWKPSEIGARPGDEIEYRVQLDDGGPLATIYLGRFSYEAWWSRLWRDHNSVVIAGLIFFAILAGYAGLLG
jgi:hypothetical protein